MLHATLAALRSFPDQLALHFADVPREYLDWRPPSWDGIPSERFTAIGQLCHVRDIEIDGYHVRIRRMLEEKTPLLASIDSEALAGPRRYAEADPDEVLPALPPAPLGRSRSRWSPAAARPSSVATAASRATASSR